MSDILSHFQTVARVDGIPKCANLKVIFWFPYFTSWNSWWYWQSWEPGKGIGWENTFSVDWCLRQWFNYCIICGAEGFRLWGSGFRLDFGAEVESGSLKVVLDIVLMVNLIICLFFAYFVLWLKMNFFLVEIVCLS